jgi:oligopeptide/dipeptide ABC transporter ATP-binding protein
LTARGSVLEVRGLSTSLVVDGRLQPVIVDVGFTVGRGEIVGLVGESGSGKSMTARTIMRLLPEGASSSGSILLDGEEVPAGGRELARARRSSMSMIFQDARAHVDPLYTNGFHVVEGLRINRNLGRRAAAEEAIRLLASVGIADPERVFRAYPSEVSGGMLQRVLIAGALTGNPTLLIADEPTTALDVTTQIEIATLLDRIRQEGRGILFITHDLDLAAALCDRTMVMYAGRIVEEQPTVRLFEQPLHPYTTGLMGARPRLDHRRMPIATIDGRAVSAFEAPGGCAFHVRCPYAVDACAAVQPHLVEVSEGGLSACLRVAEIGDELRNEVRVG